MGRSVKFLLITLRRMNNSRMIYSMRRGEAATRQAHNLEIAGANPAAATLTGQIRECSKMPNAIPIANWSEDTIQPLPAAIWVGKQIMSQQLRVAYQQDPQATLDVGLRVVSGVHELAFNRDQVVFGSSQEDQSEAIDSLRIALGIDMPFSAPSGSIPVALLVLIARELLRRLIDELMNEDV